jgi:formylglycine-generating enzyme required for sulfatase activity
MALLEGGRFEGARGETAADEPPATRTSWVGPFCLDRTEVTRSAYAACIARGICRRSYLMNTSTFCDPETKEREREPVTCVLSFDADTYCGHLGRRLPTDDEWLFAARGRAVGGHGRRFPWGDEPPDATRLDVSGLEPVGSFPLGATPEGILDLAGNVSEITSTTVPAAGSIIRGGSYLVPLVDEARERTITEHGDPGIGFRCAK